MWIAYLAGVTGGFEHGPSHVFQTVAAKQAAKQAAKAASPLPPTRDDLYRPAPSQGQARDPEMAPPD
jgi:cyclopropane-fatty-acyl-phospholipid synthase